MIQMDFIDLQQKLMVQLFMLFKSRFYLDLSG